MNTMLELTVQLGDPLDLTIRCNVELTPSQLKEVRDAINDCLTEIIKHKEQQAKNAHLN